ncbi:MAG: ATP-binding protein [Candidatus Riflebacteria bacterium]|nr:ATP-binding protein [Candidatus Riflebacteria bacterium]
MIVEKVPEEIVMNLFSTRYFDSVRKKTEEIARRMGFDDEQVFDLALVVDEAYVNAIEHGAEGKKETELEIKFLIYEDKLEVSIKDGGCGFDMNTVSVPDDLKSITSTRGRGLGLIKLLTDEFSMESRPGFGTTVKFSKYI